MELVETARDRRDRQRPLETLVGSAEQGKGCSDDLLRWSLRLLSGTVTVPLGSLSAVMAWLAMPLRLDTCQPVGALQRPASSSQRAAHAASTSGHSVDRCRAIFSSCSRSLRRARRSMRPVAPLRVAFLT